MQSFSEPETGSVYWCVYDEHKVWMCWVDGSVHDVTAIHREERWCFNRLTTYMFAVETLADRLFLDTRVRKIGICRPAMI